MSNEEQAVLAFFSQEENLPLALSVAELVDGIRQRMNNAFWRALHERIAALLAEHRLPWGVALTEDRNTPDCVVGLHLQPMSEQALFLRLMMEQQYMGETLRIYYGVMWNSAPSPEKANLSNVAELREALQGEGLKNNESFLAWNWTPYHPRRKDFLQRYSTEPDVLLEEADGLLRHLLLDHGEALNAANEALMDVPRSVTVSLDQLRAKIATGSVRK
jgi:hypothetical protein